MNCVKCGAFIDDPWFMIIGQSLCPTCYQINDITMLDQNRTLEKDKEGEKHETKGRSY